MKKNLILTAFLVGTMVVSAQQKFVITPSAGFAWRTGEKPSGLSPDAKNYLDDLSKGFNFDIGAYYMKNQDLGFGVKYNSFSSTAEVNSQSLFPDETIDNVRLKTDDKITFIGAGVYGGNFTSEVKHKIVGGLALGYISYSSSTAGVEVTGGNLGISGDLGYQYKVSPSFLVGPQFGFTGGTLTKFKVQGQSYKLEDDQKENLFRVSLGLGATIRF